MNSGQRHRTRSGSATEAVWHEELEVSDGETAGEGMRPRRKDYGFKEVVEADKIAAEVCLLMSQYDRGGWRSGD
jgi:hypothetical protein